MEWKQEEILIIVKVYPTPSNKYGETVCTAGITKDEKWIRLYPVPYRDLLKEQQYEKFQWIKVDVTPSNEMLRRPESFKVNPATIEVLNKIPAGSHWSEREKYFIPTISNSLEEILENQASSNVSLGSFKPKEVKSFNIIPDDGEWNAKQLKILQQKTLFNSTRSTLEKIPYKFKYKFTCNDDRCKGHDMTIFDWELAQSYRNYKRIYKTEELTLEKLSKKWLDYFFKERESYFIVGTDSRWGSFMILGIVSPRRKQDQLSFDF